MREARRFTSQENQVFLAGFSSIFLRFSCKYKDRLNNCLEKDKKLGILISVFNILWVVHNNQGYKWALGWVEKVMISNN